MPADFLLSSANPPSSGASSSRQVDLFQSNQSDSAADPVAFKREFEREVQRGSTTEPRNPRDSGAGDASRSGRTDNPEAAKTRSRNDQSGKSLPDRSGEAPSGSRHANGAERKADGESAAETRNTVQSEPGHRESAGNHQAESRALADHQNAVAILDQQQAGKQLSVEQRQALEALQTELGKLQLNKLSSEDRQRLMEQFQVMAQKLGVDVKALVARLQDLANAGEQQITPESLDAMIKELVGDDGDSLKDLVAVLGGRQTQDGAPSETLLDGAQSQQGGDGPDKTGTTDDAVAVVASLTDNPTDIRDKPANAEDSASKEEQPTVAALVGNLKNWLDQVLDKGSDNSAIKGPLAKDDEPASQKIIADIPSSASAGGNEAGPSQVTDLTALLNGNGFTLNPELAKAPDNAVKNAAPWAVAQLQSGQGFVVRSTLTERINALAQGVSGINDPAADAASAEDSDTSKTDLAKEVDFLLKSADKLSGKSRDSLGELTLADLAGQAKQMLKNADGPLEQKLKAAVEQIKSVMAETAKTDTSAESGSNRSSSTNAQPVSAFMRSLEQAAANGNVQKAQMTMQNHFNKPAWAGELGQRMMMMVGQKIQVAEIRLDPPDLGPMEVKIRMQQDQAHVVFHSQHAAVRDALEQAIPRLRELFDQNGVGLGDVDVQDQTAQQRQGDDQEGGSLLASGGDGTEGDLDGQDAEQVTVTRSDRLVDFYA